MYPRKISEKGCAARRIEGNWVLARSERVPKGGKKREKNLLGSTLKFSGNGTKMGKRKIPSALLDDGR